MAQGWAQSFYASKVWKQVRHEVLRRDGHTCHDCYARSSEVHHIIELTPDNINDPMIALNLDNLIALCSICHKKITKGYTGDVEEGYIFDDEGQVIRQ